MKYKWRVQPAPTGRFRSFERRGWPMAEYDSGQIAAAIYCKDEYRPADVRVGSHAELTVRIADHREKPWQWRTLKQRFTTLDAAKKGFEEFISKNPQFCPKDPK